MNMYASTGPIPLEPIPLTIPADEDDCLCSTLEYKGETQNIFYFPLTNRLFVRDETPLMLLMIDGVAIYRPSGDKHNYYDVDHLIHHGFYRDKVQDAKMKALRIKHDMRVAWNREDVA